MTDLQLLTRLFDLTDAFRALLEAGTLDDYRGRCLLREVLAVMRADIDEYSERNP